MPRDPRQKCNRSWEDLYGTTASGNLPQYKTKECVSSVITELALNYIQGYFPWVGIEDFHYHHIKCPYSTEAGIHMVMDRNIGSPTYWQGIDVSSETLSHTTTSGFMIRFSRGSKHGWLCVDPNCPYYQGTVSGSIKGRPYFYI
jgi:hypothetical protein